MKVSHLESLANCWEQSDYDCTRNWIGLVSAEPLEARSDSQCFPSPKARAFTLPGEGEDLDRDFIQQSANNTSSVAT